MRVSTRRERRPHNTAEAGGRGYPEAAHFECLRGVVCEPCTARAPAARRRQQRPKPDRGDSRRAPRSSTRSRVRLRAMGEHAWVSIAPARRDARRALAHRGSRGLALTARVTRSRSCAAGVCPPRAALERRIVSTTWPRGRTADLRRHFVSTGRRRGHGVGVVSRAERYAYAPTRRKRRARSASATNPKPPCAEVVEGR
jgi:hypothetical protein